tara:strand:- start:110 stop:289 length:180 start_codon:yes stop_codon:yes gene_type:complete
MTFVFVLLAFLGGTHYGIFVGQTSIFFGSMRTKIKKVLFCFFDFFGFFGFLTFLVFLVF